MLQPHVLGGLGSVCIRLIDRHTGIVSIGHALRIGLLREILNQTQHDGTAETLPKMGIYVARNTVVTHLIGRWAVDVGKPNTPLGLSMRVHTIKVRLWPCLGCDCCFAKDRCAALNQQHFAISRIHVAWSQRCK